MVTTETWSRRDLFKNERWAKLLIDTLYHYRGQAYLLYEFVVMPDHIDALLMPQTSLEKAVQCIKGGFSFRAKKELGSNMEVWQKGFQDHRIRRRERLCDVMSHIFITILSKRDFARARINIRILLPTLDSNLTHVPQGLKPQSMLGLGTWRGLKKSCRAAFK